MPNSVIFKRFNNPVIDEKDAAGTITPGMLIERTAADKVQAHSTSEGNAIPMFAVEDELQGNGINDNYSADDKVQCWFPVAGERVNAILVDGENVVIGDYLASNGDGYLKKHVADDSGSIQTQAVVGRALEAQDLSDSSGGESSGALGYNKRLKIEII
jgi:hypothetical protein